MSKKINFRMHEDLLKDVIFEQAGSVIKAIEETIQNSLDANATKIEIIINEKGMIIIDNGCGMNKEEIMDRFTVFGNSVKKALSNKRGKFAMGRGQVFAQGFTHWRTREYEMRTNCKRSLSYYMKEGMNNYEGTEIRVWFYKELGSWTLSDTITGIKEYVVLDNVELIINGNKYECEKEIIEEYTTDEFVVFRTNNYAKRIFAQNLYVNTYNTTTDLNIHCLNKMELNFARNQFLEDRESTKRLFELTARIEKGELLKAKRYDATTGKKVVDFIRRGQLEVKDFMSKKIIELADGSMVSFNDLKGKEIMFGSKNNESDRAIQQGYTVVSDSFEYILKDIRSQKKVEFSITSLRPNDVVPTGYHRSYEIDDLKKKQGKKAEIYWYFAVKMNEDVFGEDRYISLGESDIAEAWTNGVTEIFLEKRMFANCNAKHQVLMNIYHVLCHEYAHEDDDTNETAHDGNFYKRYYELVERTQRKIGEFMLTELKDIKEEYYL